MSRKRRQRPVRRYVEVITEAEAGFPHAVAMRDGARSILKNYADPPEGGTLVPRAWVEENRDVLEALAEAEDLILGDPAKLASWKPTGILNILPSGAG